MRRANRASPATLASSLISKLLANFWEQVMAKSTARGERIPKTRFWETSSVDMLSRVSAEIS